MSDGNLVKMVLKSGSWGLTSKIGEDIKMSWPYHYHHLETTPSREISGKRRLGGRKGGQNGGGGAD